MLLEAGVCLALLRARDIFTVLECLQFWFSFCKHSTSQLRLFTRGLMNTFSVMSASSGGGFDLEIVSVTEETIMPV